MSSSTAGGTGSGASRLRGRDLDAAVHRALWPEDVIDDYRTRVRVGQAWYRLPSYSTQWAELPGLRDRARQLGLVEPVVERMRRSYGDDLTVAIREMVFGAPTLLEELCIAIVAVIEEKGT